MNSVSFAKLYNTTTSILKATLYMSARNMELNLNTLDKSQVQLLKEECIEVDENDKVLGPKSKLDCHLIRNGPPLHRAFSLFLFNTKNELLLQKRADSKITFPGYYTNTCCSHPLFNKTELNENLSLGVRHAAQRRTKAELGVPFEQLPIDDIAYITRIHYKANSNDQWGEHEIDHVLIARKDVDLDINPNEVSEIRYVSKEGMTEFTQECERTGVPLTPWFKLILKGHLFTWWDNLHNLDAVKGQDKIIRCIE
uniref:isopentenyl-diphosphate Delta-isomerase n=1 Tax=Ciona savignyi TaxID=51511 RepID=H2YV55_CIOSA